MFKFNYLRTTKNLINLRYTMMGNNNNSELKARLTPLQYQVTQNQATEPPFNNEFNKHKKEGQYNCIVCETPLFMSESKFDSGCGWPAFAYAINAASEIKMDKAHGMVREEVVCSKCKAHLGHRFEDGPKPLGQRYCINSASLSFADKVPK